MSLIDNVVEIFNQGPSNWSERVLEGIGLISPEGNEFVAKWSGDSREFEKKLGVFVFPNVKGNIVQDLDVNSTAYTIPFYFDGDDCDLIAKAFFQAARQRGRWTVTHPVYGFLELQLVRIKETNNPVADGGIVSIETDWIEPIDETTLLTAAEAAGLVSASIDGLNDSAFSEFTEALDASTEALKNSIDAVVNGISNVVDAALEPLFSSVDFLDNTISLINNGIQDTLNASVLDVLSLGGQIQNLIQAPALATTSLSASQEYYTGLATALIADLPDTSGRLSREDRNHLLITELALNATIASMAKIALLGVKRAQSAQQSSVVASESASLAGVQVTITATGDVIEATPLETRAQAVEAAQETLDFFKSTVESLEDKQEDFETEDIDNQYFSQLSSYPDAAKLMAQTAQYLLLSSFDLKTERRFVLNRPRMPIDITAVEYGTLGDNDSNLDLFIRSNGLTGKDIYLLPSGREIVIYE